jgi:hypothetical protein
MSVGVAEPAMLLCIKNINQISANLSKGKQQFHLVFWPYALGNSRIAHREPRAHDAESLGRVTRLF